MQPLGEEGLQLAARHQQEESERRPGAVPEHEHSDYIVVSLQPLVQHILPRACLQLLPQHGS